MIGSDAAGLTDELNDRAPAGALRRAVLKSIDGLETTPIGESEEFGRLVLTEWSMARHGLERSS